MGGKNQTGSWPFEHPDVRNPKVLRWDIHLLADEHAVGESADKTPKGRNRKAQKPAPAAPASQSFKSQVGDDHDFSFDCPWRTDEQVKESRTEGDSKGEEEKVEKDKRVPDIWNADGFIGMALIY